MPPEIVVCAACQTKLKVPEKSTAKALRCPKCKGVVPIPRNPDPPPKPEPSPPKVERQEPAEVKEPPKPVVKEPPKKEEEFEVNEAAEDEEEFEVNEVAEDEEEHEVNEPAEEDEDEEEEAPLAKLGFAGVKNVFKKGEIPEAAQKAVEKMFLDNEKPLWAGKPSKEMIESKAWIGLVLGPILISSGCCSGIGIPLMPFEGMGRIVAIGFGVLFFLVLVAIGVLVIVFRKVIGGNSSACYVVTNQRAYIYDGYSSQVRAFTPAQLAEMHCVPSAHFEDAGDLIFAYDLNDANAEGVMTGRDRAEEFGTAKVGFLYIKDVQLVREMMHELLIDPGLEKLKKAKKKQKRERGDYFS